jgi:hypothetical protein
MGSAMKTKAVTWARRERPGLLVGSGLWLQA